MTNVSDITKELKDQGLPINVVQNLMTQMNNLIRCGPTCQRNNKIDELKKKYEAAQEEVQGGPEQLKDARKNYFSYAYGDSYYHDYENRQNLAKAKEVKEKIRQEFQDESEQVREIKSNNRALESSKKNLNRLLNKYLASNEKMELKIGERIGRVKTSDRKVFYENNEIEAIMYYNTILKNLYWFLITIYVIVFLYKGLYANKSDIIILIFFFAMPFVVNPFVRTITRFVKYLAGNLPKNMYLNL